MSVQLYSASAPGGNDASLQGTTVGGRKPLHRFIRGQPKIVGIIVLVLGVSFLIVAISVNVDITIHQISSAASPAFLSGTLFTVSGIVYILTEHKPTKKFVTISLALSVVTIIAALWCIMHTVGIIFTGSHHYNHYYYFEENTTDTEDVDWTPHSESMGVCLEALFLFYTSVGIVIFIVMSSLARAALHSTKSQALVVMTATPTQAAAE